MALTTIFRRVSVALFAVATTLGAQEQGPGTLALPDSVKPAPAAKAPALLFRTIEVQRLRPADQRGLNMFEPPKNDPVPFDGFALHIGGAFLQSYQALTHENTASPRLVNNVDANKLMAIGNGFNNSVANLFIAAQLADGIRVSMTTYLSARHHNETWVKDGYLSVDKSPLDVKFLNDAMEYLTFRFGQFEVNYGDQHFRRTDNGQGMYNPFVGNLIMDAMTTEVGGDLTFKRNGWMAMAGFTNAESKGLVTVPSRRTAAYLGKFGVDKQVNADLRVRLTASMYTTSKANNNVLYSGDRAGSRYYFALENTTATEVAQAWSGQLNPGFGHNVKAFVVNPFVKWQGFEFFGNIETSKGRAWTETIDREWKQNAFEALYRFADDKVYLGGRYNTAAGALAGFTTGDVNIKRTQVGGGWYVTPSILMKFELVDQKYDKFPSTDIRNGGRFKGFLIEGAVGF